MRFRNFPFDSIWWGWSVISFHCVSLCEIIIIISFWYSVVFQIIHEAIQLYLVVEEESIAWNLFGIECIHFHKPTRPTNRLILVDLVEESYTFCVPVEFIWDGEIWNVDCCVCVLIKVWTWTNHLFLSHSRWYCVSMALHATYQWMHSRVNPLIIRYANDSKMSSCVPSVHGVYTKVAWIGLRMSYGLNEEIETKKCSGEKRCDEKWFQLNAIRK